MFETPGRSPWAVRLENFHRNFGHGGTPIAKWFISWTIALGLGIPDTPHFRKPPNAQLSGGISQRFGRETHHPETRAVCLGRAWGAFPKQMLCSWRAGAAPDQPSGPFDSIEGEAQKAKTVTHMSRGSWGSAITETFLILSVKKPFGFGHLWLLVPADPFPPMALFFDSRVPIHLKIILHWEDPTRKIRLFDSKVLTIAPSGAGH